MSMREVVVASWFKLLPFHQASYLSEDKHDSSWNGSGFVPKLLLSHAFRVRVMFHPIDTAWFSARRVGFLLLVIRHVFQTVMRSRVEP